MVDNYFLQFLFYKYNIYYKPKRTKNLFDPKRFFSKGDWQRALIIREVMRGKKGDRKGSRTMVIGKYKENRNFLQNFTTLRVWSYEYSQPCNTNGFDIFSGIIITIWPQVISLDFSDLKFSEKWMTKKIRKHIIRNSFLFNCASS